MSGLRSILGKLRRSAGTRLAAATGPVTHVGEITPCPPRRGQPRAGRRLNLILPSINRQHYFGGIHTAVQMYRELSRHFDESRIVLFDAAPDAEALARFDDHVPVASGQDPAAPRQIVPFNDRFGKTLPVSEGDYWLATSWWTAYAAQRIARWQAGEGAPERPVAYLIQDFEPGFYPWSSQHALALSTYRPDVDIGIFNTGLLADFFAREGLRYARQCVFEPELNDGLRAALRDARAAEGDARERRVVIYARPGTPRNAFELICEGLRLWGWQDVRSQSWSFVAPGELSGDIDLGPVTLQAMGKLDISRYADLLASSSIGISLMVSPHPSYPPLEMAAFGMSVLTNRFANKDLGTVDNTVPLDDMTPEAIARGLTGLMDAIEARGMLPGPILDDGAPFLGSRGLAAAAERVAASWTVC